jgi:hypothetical protein
MVCHKCTICGLEFNKKSRLVEHHNKKFKCKPINNNIINCTDIYESNNNNLIQN